MHPVPLVDVWYDGKCLRGHIIQDVLDTIVYPNQPGRFCMRCHETLPKSMLRKAIIAQKIAAKEANEAIVDETAIERRKKGDPVTCTGQELHIAAAELTVEGFTPTAISEMLHISVTHARVLLADNHLNPPGS
jgi:hypothetical protein